MKFKKILPLCLLLFLALFCGILRFSILRPASAPTEDTSFLAFTKELFHSQIASDTLTLHYTFADPSRQGIPEAPATLPLYSSKSESVSRALLENTRAALHTFSRENLSKENQLTYDILDYQLDREIHLASYPYFEEIFSPSLGIQAQLPILLAEYTFRSRQDVENYLSLLRQLDTYYASLLEYQQQKAASGLFMSDATVDAVLAQCREFIAQPTENFLLSTFEERISQADFLTESAKSTYLETNRSLVLEHVIPAYELLIEGIAALKGSGANSQGLCYYDRGREYYLAWIACNTGSGHSMEEIITLVEEQLDTDLETISFLATEHPELLRTAARGLDAPKPDYILEMLAQNIQADFPAPEQVSCQIKYVDPSLENFLSPAFYLTPPLDQREEHVIYINPAENFDNLTLFTTLAHEGYPGHLYQTLFETSAQLNPVRSLFYFGGYVEGWATYAEQFSYSYTSLEPNAAALLSANSSVSLGLHARADIGIHYEGWTREEAASFFAGYGITDKEVVHTIYQTILEAPGNYLKYYLGAVEIQELKKQAEAILGEEFTEKNFHEFLLTLGPAPFPVIEAYMSEWINQRTPC